MVKELKDIVPNITLEQQQEINKREALAFKTGAFHVAYGLLALMGLVFFSLASALFFPVYIIEVVVISSVLSFGFTVGIFVDVWAHGYSH